MHRTLDDFLAKGLAGRKHGQELLALLMAIADAARTVSANTAKGRLAGQPGGANAVPDASVSAALQHATTSFFDAVSGPGLAEVIFQARPALAPGLEQKAAPLQAAITA
ncbi:MAG: hypothetical protein EBU74_09010, partial [Betaproteobacteria bacterium]|nr:hypothetical protein [Betaproteobacteria bacterium]